jgi:hypothetical protein
MANEAWIEEISGTLNEKLKKYKKFHNEQYKIYGGKWSPSALGISVSAELDAKIEVYLDYSRIECDFIANQMNFDVLVGDEWGLLAYLEMANVDRVIKSAIKNSLIGSCSFVSTTPGNPAFGEPPIVLTAHTGYEATGIFNSRTGKLDAGIAVETYNKDGEPETFLLFMPDGTYRIDKDGKIEKLFESKTGCQLTLFPWDQDLASRPFGRPRTNASQKSLAGSAIRTLKRAELAGEFFSSPMRYILTKVNEADEENKMEVWNSTLGTLLEYQSAEGEDNPEVGQLPASDPEPYVKQFRMIVEQYAAGAAMNPQEFGAAPSNGGMSADSEAERSRKTRALIADAQGTYGEAIKQVAINAAGILKMDIVPEMHLMKAAWTVQILETDLVKIGDGLIKSLQVAPDIAETDFVNEKLGISKRSRLDRSGGLPKEMSPEGSLSSMSPELQAIITGNTFDPENRISGVSPSDIVS